MILDTIFLLPHRGYIAGEKYAELLLLRDHIGHFNSLAPGRFEWKLNKLMLVIDDCCISWILSPGDCHWASIH